MSKSLITTDQDKQDYAQLKEVVDKNQAEFFAVGSALAQIRERELFKIDGFKTFNKFVEAIYQWSPKYCSDLVIGAKVIKSLPALLQERVTTFTAARALSQVEEPLREAVLEAATEEVNKPGKAPKKIATAKSIKKHTPASSKPPKKKQTSERASLIPKKTSAKKGEVFKDKTDFEIPTELLPLWYRAHEAIEVVTYIKGTILKVGKFTEAKDQLYHEVNVDSLVSSLKQAQADAERGIPYAVCATCSGLTPEGCNSCHGTGFVSEFFWDKCVTEEDKAMRAAKPITESGTNSSD
jgi:hypothetical protein